MEWNVHQCSETKEIHDHRFVHLIVHHSLPSNWTRLTLSKKTTKNWCVVTAKAILYVSPSSTSLMRVGFQRVLRYDELFSLVRPFSLYFHMSCFVRPLVECRSTTPQQRNNNNKRKISNRKRRIEPSVRRSETQRGNSKSNKTISKIYI